MARSRSFVPRFDRLGLRITPSEVASPCAATGGYFSDLPPDNSELPGSDRGIEDTITWDTPEDPSPETTDRADSSLACVDWMLPLTTNN